MDADLPTPDRVDLDPYDAEDEAIVAAGEAPDTVSAPADPASTEPGVEDRLDLDAIEADLAGVEVALARLSEGTYWTDEVTGGPLPDDVLASTPTARRA
jgi:RNA polymerase-binding transcription factor DksA